MIIKEFIEELKKYPEDTEIVLFDDHMEQGEIIVFPSLKKGKVFKETRSFMDAFDYEEYISTVWRRRRDLEMPKATDTPVVIIGKGIPKK